MTLENMAPQIAPQGGAPEGGPQATPGEPQSAPQSEPTPSLERVRERQLQAQRFQALTQRERNLQQKEAALREREARYGKFDTLFEGGAEKPDPMKILTTFGYDYNDVTRAALTQQPSDQPSGRVQEIASKLSEVEKRLQEREQNERVSEQQQLLDKQYLDIQTAVEAAGEDKYPLVKAGAHWPVILDVASTVYNQSQRVLSWDEAAALVEDQLVDEFKNAYAPLMKHDWFRQKVGVEFAPPSEQSFVPPQASTGLGVPSPQRSAAHLPAESGHGGVGQQDRPLTDEQLHELALKAIRRNADGSVPRTGW